MSKPKKFKMVVNDSTFYDPPSGWRYGFPKPYKPLTPDEPLHVTLLRDGYPEEDIDFATQHCRFIGVTFEEEE